MKGGLTFLLSLLLGHSIALAQTADTAVMVQMIEWKYKSARVFNETYGISRAYWLKKVPEITGRFAFTSESGRFYGFTNTRGLNDLGAYIGSRDQVSAEFRKDHPAVAEKIMNNMDGPTTRSYWQIVGAISTTASDYDPNKFNFRKMTIFSVPFNAEAQFENLMKAIIEAERKAGIDFSRLFAKSVDGYPMNYYILMYPDIDELSYYQKKNRREQVRESNAQLAELLEKLKGMMTIVRVDHLNRIRFE